MNAEEKIKKALFELLHQYRLTQLTVTAICKQAGVSRPTFYHYFDDKYALIITVYEDDISQCLQNDSWQEIMVDALHYIQQHAKYIQAILDYHGQNSFTAFLLTYTRQCTVKLIQDQGGWPMTDKMQYSLSMFTYGVCYTLIDWVKAGCQDSPQKFTWLVAKEMPATLKPYLLKGKIAQ